MDVENSVNSSSAPRPPGEPAVIRRLPAGAEYTFIKLVTHDVPPPLTTVTWVPADVDVSPWGWFQTKTFGWIDHELQKREHAPPAATTEERQEAQALRHEFVQQFNSSSGRSVLRQGRPRSGYRSDSSTRRGSILSISPQAHFAWPAGSKCGHTRPTVRDFSQRRSSSPSPLRGEIRRFRGSTRTSTTRHVARCSASTSLT